MTFLGDCHMNLSVPKRFLDSVDSVDSVNYSFDLPDNTDIM
jgi:hypothetical protein